MNATQIATAEAALANGASHVLVFEARVPALGFATFTASRAACRSNCASLSAPAQHPPSLESGTSRTQTKFTVSSDTYSLDFDRATGLLVSLTNLKSGASTPLRMDMGWYNSSVGGCTTYGADVPANLREDPCEGQKSGAYIFRPNSSTVFYPGATAVPQLTVVDGPIVTEVHQVFSEWATGVYRLYKRQPYVEVEWTVGPIPMDTPWIKASEAAAMQWGKEVVVRYASGLESNGTFYADSNGKEMVRREYNRRGPSYPFPYKISEEVAGNYYPVNAMISVDDGTHELAVLIDTSVGGASLADGEVELMVHRRLQADDSRGVQEPLNETMCGCNDINADPGKMGQHGHEGDGGCECAGLTMRGRHWLIFDSIVQSHLDRRVLGEALNFPATLAFATEPRSAGVPSFSALKAALPPSVKLVTITNNYAAFNGGKWLLRLAHLYQAGEHPTLSVPVEVDLSKVFGKAGLRLVAAEEVSLTANQGRDAMEASRFQWDTRTKNAGVAEQLESCAAFEERVPFKYPLVTIRPMEVRTFLASFTA